MQPELRRIIVADAHRRRTGRCPVLLHSLGTGESFRITPTPDGLIDVESGLRAGSVADGIELAGDTPRIVLTETDDVAASGYEPVSHARFSVRAGGGTSVTLFISGTTQYWQFAVDDQA